MSHRASRLASCVLVASAAALALSAPADAKRRGKSPLKYFGGEIIISKKRFPRKFKSDKDMIKHMKKAETRAIYAKAEGKWEFEYMVFSTKPVGTLQATVTYYDITNPGSQRMVNTYTFYAADKKDRIINGHASLSEDSEFKPNKKYLMVFSRSIGGRPLATTQFVLYPPKD